MMNNLNFKLGLVCVAFALVTALAWIPYDVETSYFEISRRQYSIGDALAPTLAAAFILIGGGLLLTFERRTESGGGLSLANVRYVLVFLIIVAIAFSLMRWSGPAMVAIANGFGSEDLSYRLLRDTPFWKHIGYVAGGGFLIVALISLVQGQLRWRSVVVALVAILAMIGLYDLPFDDLLLPPNGDV